MLQNTELNMMSKTNKSPSVRTDISKPNFIFSLLLILNKITPIVLFFGLSSYKILDFTFVILFASIDFWLLKNIIGKKLVGMIWWMKINQETGDQEWIFYSNPQNQLNKLNEGVFWGCNLGGCIFWGFSSLISLIISRLFWIAVCGVCFLLSALNLSFFMRCRGQHQVKFKGFAQKIGLQSVNRLVEQI